MATPNPNDIDLFGNITDPAKRAVIEKMLRQFGEMNPLQGDPDKELLNNTDAGKKFRGNLGNELSGMRSFAELARRNQDATLANDQLKKLGDFKGLVGSMNSERDRFLQQANAAQNAGDDAGYQSNLKKAQQLEKLLGGAEDKIKAIEGILNSVINTQGDPNGGGGGGSGGNRGNPLNRLRETLDNLAANIQKQSKSHDNMVGMFTRMLGAFGIQQQANRILFSDPYRYEVSPAFNLAKRTGALGNVIGSGLDSEYQFQMQRNQEAFTGGMVATGLGARAMFQKGAGSKVAGGMALLAGGASMFGGATGGFDDLYDQLATSFNNNEWIQALSKSTGTDLHLQTSRDARITAMADGLMQPENIKNLLAAGKGANAAFGFGRAGSTATNFYTDKDAMSNKVTAASAIIDQMNRLDRQEGKMTMGEKGYDEMMSLQLMGQLAQAVNVSGDAARDETRRFSSIEATTGATMGSITSMGSTLSSVGAKDGQIDKLMSTIYGAVGDGNKPTPYQAEQIAPALMRVVQSTALRNVGANVEESTKKVAMVYNEFKNANLGNMSKLVENNPDYLQKIVSGFDQTLAASSTNSDAAKFLLRYMSGEQYSALRFGWSYQSPDGKIDNLKTITGLISGMQADFNTKGMSVEELNRNTGLMNFLQDKFQFINSSLSPIEIATLMTQGDFKNTPRSKIESQLKLVDQNLAKDDAKLQNDRLVHIQGQINDNNNAFNVEVTHLTSAIGKAQNLMQNYINSGKLSADADAGAQKIVDRLAKQLGEASLNIGKYQDYKPDLDSIQEKIDKLLKIWETGDNALKWIKNEWNSGMELNKKIWGEGLKELKNIPKEIKETFHEFANVVQKSFNFIYDKLKIGGDAISGAWGAWSDFITGKTFTAQKFAELRGISIQNSAGLQSKGGFDKNGNYSASLSPGSVYLDELSRMTDFGIDGGKFKASKELSRLMLFGEGKFPQSGLNWNTIQKNLTGKDFFKSDLYKSMTPENMEELTNLGLNINRGGEKPYLKYLDAWINRTQKGANKDIQKFFTAKRESLKKILANRDEDGNIKDMDALYNLLLEVDIAAQSIIEGPKSAGWKPPAPTPTPPTIGPPKPSKVIPAKVSPNNDPLLPNPITPNNDTQFKIPPTPPTTPKVTPKTPSKTKEKTLRPRDQASSLGDRTMTAVINGQKGGDGSADVSTDGEDVFVTLALKGTSKEDVDRIVKNGLASAVQKLRIG